MAITTTSVIADTIPTIIEEAQFTAQQKAIMKTLCWNIKKELHKGSTVNIPYWGEASASSLTEGVDMASPTSMSDTNVSITPAEVGCQILYSWKAARDNQEDIARAAGRILGDAMEKKRDQDLLGQLDDASTSIGAGGTATLGQIAAARSILEAVPAPFPYAVVHHPYVLLDLVDVFTPIVPTATYLNAAGGSVADDVLRNYLKGELFGMPVFADGNIDTVSGKGGVFSTGKGGSIILATADEWDVYPEDDASLRATEINCVGEYGVGEYLASWIVELYHDATTPA